MYFLINLYRYIRTLLYLNRIYEAESIIKKMSETLGAQVKKDWIGRLYVIYNPLVRDGKYVPEQVYGIDGTADEWVKKMFLNQMNIIQGFVVDTNLFELLYVNYKPIDELNYLITLVPQGFDKLKWFWELLVELLLISIILFII